MRWIVAAVATLVGVIPAAAADTWKEYRSEAGGFTVLLPGEPKLEDKEMDTALGKVTLHSASVTAQRGHVSCRVDYCDFPTEAMAKASVEDLLDGVREGALRSARGKPVGEEKALELDGNPGREFRFELTQDGQAVQGTARFYLVGPRLYQLFLIHTQRARLTQDDVDRFFSSFTRIEPKAPSPPPSE